MYIELMKRAPKPLNVLRGGDNTVVTEHDRTVNTASIDQAIEISRRHYEVKSAREKREKYHEEAESENAQPKTNVTNKWTTVQTVHEYTVRQIVKHKMNEHKLDHAMPWHRNIASANSEEPAKNTPKHFIGIYWKRETEIT